MKLWIVESLLTVLVLVAGEAICAAQPPAAREDFDSWIQRPWEIRYFLTVQPSTVWQYQMKMAKEDNALPDARYFDYSEFFHSTSEIKLSQEKSPAFSNKPLAVVAIEFDKQGLVTTPNSHSGQLQGRLHRLQYVSLTTSDSSSDIRYDLGYWFTGLGDASTHWAPGICENTEVPLFANNPSAMEMYKYGSKYKVDPQSATFGCREWAYQLYDDARPYIDVTSYVPKNKQYPSGTFIRDFIGWARFGDSKPVIGKHESSWYCLHDCPNNEKPGLIPDIKAWTFSHGWSVPKPPTKAPIFPDPPAKSGIYPK